MPLTGTCLCAGVCFEVRGRLTPIQCCHATRCRKATGSAFAPEVAARSADFRWIRGEELVRVFEAPLLHEPPAYRRAFCRVCGSPLPVVNPGAPFVVLLAGVLNEDPEVRPFRHVFVGSKAPWFEILDELPKFLEHVPKDQRLPTRTAVSGRESP